MVVTTPPIPPPMTATLKLGGGLERRVAHVMVELVKTVLDDEDGCGWQIYE